MMQGIASGRPFPTPFLTDETHFRSTQLLPGVPGAGVAGVPGHPGALLQCADVGGHSGHAVCAHAAGVDAAHAAASQHGHVHHAGCGHHDGDHPGDRADHVAGESGRRDLRSHPVGRAELRGVSGQDHRGHAGLAAPHAGCPGAAGPAVHPAETGRQWQRDRPVPGLAGRQHRPEHGGCPGQYWRAAVRAVLPAA